MMKWRPGNLLKARSSTPVESDWIHCRDVCTGKDLDDIERYKFVSFQFNLQMETSFSTQYLCSIVKATP